MGFIGPIGFIGLIGFIGFREDALEGGVGFAVLGFGSGGLDSENRL